MDQRRTQSWTLGFPDAVVVMARKTLLEERESLRSLTGSRSGAASWVDRVPIQGSVLRWAHRIPQRISGLSRLGQSLIWTSPFTGRGNADASVVAHSLQPLSSWHRA